MDLKDKFDEISFHHVMRDRNKVADHLSNIGVKKYRKIYNFYISKNQDIDPNYGELELNSSTEMEIFGGEELELILADLENENFIEEELIINKDLK